MKLYLNKNPIIPDSCNAKEHLISVSIDNTDSLESFCQAYRSMLLFIANRFNLSIGILVYKKSQHGFSRVERYKGLKTEISDASKCAEWKEFVIHGDRQEEYMYAFSEVDLDVLGELSWKGQDSMIFMGSKSDFADILTILPELKSPKKIRESIIAKSVVLVQSFCVCEMSDMIDGAIWLISSPQKILEIWHNLKDAIKTLDPYSEFEED